MRVEKTVQPPAVVDTTDSLSALRYAGLVHRRRRRRRRRRASPRVVVLNNKLLLLLLLLASHTQQID